ncbi:MAG TPA: hypothetical protein VNP73_04715 [Actinomycetota bacterium]|nr:hypothetical protein [Actinomycetota bacterium]
MRKTLRLLLGPALIGSILAAPLGAAAGHQRPYVHVAGIQEAGGGLEVVGHSPLNNRGMNAALAVHGDYAYVGSRTDAKAGNANGAGVLVVDVSKPEAPEVVHEIGPPDEANPGETSREMRIWHEQELLIVMTLFSNCGEIHACSPIEGQDRFNFYDISGKNAAAPKLVATYEPSENPHEFFLWEDPKDQGRALLFISNPGGGAQLTVTDISQARKGKFTELLKMSPLYNGGNLHSLGISADGKRGYLAHLAGGVGVIDTSLVTKGAKKPAIKVLTLAANAAQWPGPGPHSAVKIPGQDYMLITDEVYGAALKALGGHGCPWGWMRAVDIGNEAKPKVVSEYKLPQNEESVCPPQDAIHPTTSFAAHNPTLTRNIAFITWHSGGLQAVDISDPAKPAQLAEFVATPVVPILQEDPILSSGGDKVVAWSYPIIQDGLIYFVDVRNGLYVMRYKGPYEKEVAAVDFLEGNSNQGDALKLDK